MNAELQEKLYARFDSIFSQHHLSADQSNMHWGIAVGDGWYGIIEDLCQKIEAVQRVTGIITQAVQIKEKAGTLRFYASSTYPEGMPAVEQQIWGDIISDLCHAAEAKSAHTCEVCGERGELRSGRTRCEQCK